MWSPHSGFQRALESLGCWECYVQCPVISKEEPLVAADLAMQALENPFSKTLFPFSLTWLVCFSIPSSKAHQCLSSRQLMQKVFPK